MTALEPGSARRLPRATMRPVVASRRVVPVHDVLRTCTGAGGHPSGRGFLDESPRRLSHEELRVARTFASEGHEVRSVPERRGAGRTADLEVCGVPVEVKSWLTLEDRHGIVPNPRSVVNKLISAEGQSSTVVLSGFGSGLSAADAAAGLAGYSAMRPASSVRSVRVIGDGFDLSWERGVHVDLAPQGRRGADRGVGM